MKILKSLVLISIVISVCYGQENNSLLKKLVNKRDVDFNQAKELADIGRIKEVIDENYEKIKSYTNDGFEWLKLKLKNSVNTDGLVEKLVPVSLLNDRLIAKEDNKVEVLNETKNEKKKRDVLN